MHFPTIRRSSINILFLTRRAPTKQNLLCHESSAIETILNHPDFDRSEDTSNRTTLPYSSPSFSFFTPRPPRISLVLERTSSMGEGHRWTAVKRALFRLFQLLPSGAEVSVVTFGKEARTDLPPTPVRDGEREGLHGRVPRKTLPDRLGCLYCALNLTLESMQEQEGAAVLLLTGSPRRPQLLGALAAAAAARDAAVFPVVFPAADAFPEVVSRLAAAAGGKAYAVAEEGASVVETAGRLTDVFLDILRRTGGGNAQKVHHSSHPASAAEFAGTFTLASDNDNGGGARSTVTLSVDDEERVERFDLTSPSGGRRRDGGGGERGRLFAKFEDGMVVYSHRGGEDEEGIWTYRAKLYPQSNGIASSTLTPSVSVDVVTVESGPSSDSPSVSLESFTSAGTEEVDVYKQPVVIYARLTQGSHLPVLRARVR